MRIVLQRVKSAKCVVDNVTTGSIEKGYLLLVGFSKDDTEEVIDKAVYKITNLRIFEDESFKMNLNLETVNGSILSISQFTLYANTQDGNRPSFAYALNPVDAKRLYEVFNEKLGQKFNVQTGIFGASMEITLVNDGPVTIIYEF